MVKAVNLRWAIKLSTVSSAREVALGTLIRIFRDNSYSNISLNNSLRDANLSQTDRNFATRIVYGTVQYKIYIEYQLQPLIKTRLKEDYLRPLLLMSAYQIFFMDKVPNRAVLNEANNLAKKFGKPNTTGFKIVNGILRALIRRGTILPTPDNSLTFLSVKNSVPEWLVQYFISLWGEKRTASILSSLNEPAKNTVRVSRLCNSKVVFNELSELGFSPKKSIMTNDVFCLGRGGVSETELFKNGNLTIQDEAASLAVSAFNFDGHESVLDACSAPGGKTVQIAENLTNGKVTALDIHENKLRLVEQNAKRMKVTDKVITRQMDARKADSALEKGKFNKILVDAPCSGLGLLRRKPEIRYNKELSDLLNLQQIQLDILEHTSSLLSIKGELVYSTCTISEEEDEQVVEGFLKKHPNFKLQSFKTGELEAPNGILKILPDSYGSDGFFIAKFVLRG